MCGTNDSRDAVCYKSTDPVAYLAEDAKGLGILKQKRKPPTLDWPALSVAGSP